MLINPLFTMYRKNDNGFTLVEALVSAAVFVIVMTTIINILVMFIKDPVDQISRKQLEDEVQYAGHTIAHYLRSGQIDYNKTILDGNVTTDFYLNTTKYGMVEMVQLSDNDRGYIAILSGEEATAVPLSGAAVALDQLQFYVYPTDSTANIQPSVVLWIKAHLVDHENITTQYQVLITSRNYAR